MMTQRNTPHAHERHTAEHIARQAADLLREENGKPRQVTHKGRVDLVTQADEAAQALIVAHLAEAFPTDRIIAEEGSEALGGAGSRVWYVDPLDGTTNFAHGFGHFAVSIACYDEAGPLVGIVYDVLADECFSAERGAGATLNGEPMQVSAAEDLAQALVATGFPYNRHDAEDNNTDALAVFLRRTQGIRRAGAAALDFAYVAAGRLDAYWEMRLEPWDVGAGILLVREAGGTVTTYEGRSDDLFAKPIRLVASNGKLHAAMLATLNEIYG